MKTAAPLSTTIAFAFALVAVSACSFSSATSSQQRQLQFGPPPGPFRPNGPAPPQEGTGFQPAPPASFPNEQAQPGAAGVLTSAEADATTAPAEAPPSLPSAGAVIPTTGVAASGIAPGQPTIMVILPDFLVAGSGWSSYSDDVGDVKSPSSDKPADPPTSATTSPHLNELAAAAVALSMAVAGLGL